MKLLILNYSMSESSLVFSHQKEAAIRLSEQFEETFVVTADENMGSEVQGIKISTTCWIGNERMRSVIKFYRTVLPIILKNHKNLVIFSHMTEVQSFLIAPWCRILKIPHFLWYAHTSKSFYLYLSYIFLTGIITSTPGSCPIKTKKVHSIGQAVNDMYLTGSLSVINHPPLSWYHVSRIDPSKNIDLIISIFSKLRGEGWDLKLNIYGASSLKKNQNYESLLMRKYQIDINSNWLCFKGPISRSQLFSVANNHDGFVHAFQGSLDKAVLEAVMCKRLVISINPEFMKEFSIEDYKGKNLKDNLLRQFSDVLEMSPAFINEKIEMNYLKCKRDHTMDQWLRKLGKLLKDEH